VYFGARFHDGPLGPIPGGPLASGPRVGDPPGKGWHKLALEDGRATLRIRGERYPVTLSKVDDPALQDAVLAVLARKYPNHPSGEYWVFAATSRSEAATSLREWAVLRGMARHDLL
jgi:hypothetical protein